MRNGVITEADTCREFVTPRLLEAGWGVAPHAIEVMHLQGGIEAPVAEVQA